MLFSRHYHEVKTRALWHQGCSRWQTCASRIFFFVSSKHFLASVCCGSSAVTLLPRSTISWVRVSLVFWAATTFSYNIFNRWTHISTFLISRASTWMWDWKASPSHGHLIGHAAVGCILWLGLCGHLAWGLFACSFTTNETEAQRLLSQSSSRSCIQARKWHQTWDCCIFSKNLGVRCSSNSSFLPTGARSCTHKAPKRATFWQNFTQIHHESTIC